MRSISASLIAGMTGAIIAAVGMPASDNCRSASSRFAGVEARGSMVRASLPSSVPPGAKSSVPAAKPVQTIAGRRSTVEEPTSIRR